MQIDSMVTPQIIDWINEIGEEKIHNVLDVGNNIDYFKKQNLLTNSTWHAIEISNKKIQENKLEEKYHHVHQADLRMVDWSKMPKFDIAIIRNVVNNLSLEDSIDLLDNSRLFSKVTIVSIPVRPWPLDHNDGFDPERVKEGWTDVDFMKCFSHYVSKKYLFNKEIGLYFIGEWYDSDEHPDRQD